MAKKRKSMFPLPEAIDGKKWDVRASKSAMTSVKDRTMFVPATDDDESRFLRAHETAHARITPHVHAHLAAKKHGISQEAMQACEDLRVSRFLRERGISTSGAFPSQDMCDALVKMCKDSPRKLGQLLVSTKGTDDYDRFCDAVCRVVDDDETRDAVLECAEAVCTEFDRIRQRLRDQGRGNKPTTTRRGFKELTVPVARMFDMLFTQDFVPGESSLQATYGGYCPAGGADGRWGTLRDIKKSRMSRTRRPRGKGGKSWRDEGAVPIAPYRLIIDGRIFTRRQRIKGGTVLIDASGSMSFNSDDLERIISTAPGAVVAAYSGNDRSGSLTIVAERGRMASSKDLSQVAFEGGNVVDGPALRWLASMPSPRVWVSDGYVTGCGDSTARNLLDDAMSVCKQASIKRVDKAQAVEEALNETRN